ncbi:MAG: SPOR domain-containing protein [Saprospiraceae bacterium]|nr:SPOR domain-containing protein [Saprospiraceae bacterium]
MRSNNFLTYILYGLLSLTIIIAGYYACQKQREKKLKQEQDEAELQQTLRDMGYGVTDTSSASAGSAFEGGDAKESNKTDPATAKNVNTPPAMEPKTDPQPQQATKTTPQQGAKTSPQQTQTSTTKPSTGSTGPAKTVPGPGSGHWAVRAGTFAYMDGARRRLEQVIKLGYTNAEISKTSDGKAAVVVFRSNDKNAAIRVADKLESAGVDAAVFYRK